MQMTCMNLESFAFLIGACAYLDAPRDAEPEKKKNTRRRIDIPVDMQIGREGTCENFSRSHVTGTRLGLTGLEDGDGKNSRRKKKNYCAAVPLTTIPRPTGLRSDRFFFFLHLCHGGA